jgi:hypothetical protein
VAQTLAGARLHSLVGQLSICAEAVHLSSPALSVNVLACLETPLRGLSALVANPSDDAPHAPTRVEPATPTDAPPIWPNTSFSTARRLLQQNSCGASEVQYNTSCGSGSGVFVGCNTGDRQIGVTCDGCGVTCSTAFKTHTKEICCHYIAPTFPPISAPPNAPPTTKSSNCGLPSPQQTFLTIKALTDALHATTEASAPLSLKVTLRSDESLQKMVNVTKGASVEIDGAGRTITLSNFGFHVDDGTLCLHDVELTGGREVPALVVLGEAGVANASHVRISDCRTNVTVDKIIANLLSALDGCNSFKPAFDYIRQSSFVPSWLFSNVCGKFPRNLQQCCNTAQDPKADLRVALNIAAGMAVAFRCSPPGRFCARVRLRIDRFALEGGCQLWGVQLSCWRRGSCPWWRVTSTEIR